MESGERRCKSKGGLDMLQEIKEMIKDMDREERIDAVGSFFAFGGLFFICFMMSVVFG